MKINSAKHQGDTERTKQSGIVGKDSCFTLLGARQYGATIRGNSDEKYLHTLTLSVRVCVGREVRILLVLVDTMPTKDISSPLAVVRSVHGGELLTSVMRGFMFDCS